MLDQLSPRPSTVASRYGSPHTAEHQLYVSHLLEEGRSPKTMADILQTMTAIGIHLPLERAAITPADIEASADLWATTLHHSAKYIHYRKTAFVFHATNWMRLLGRLHEPRAVQPFAVEMDDFLQYVSSERGLAPSTVQHYRLFVGEFLMWLDRDGKTLLEVTLDDLSSYFQTLSRRKLKRTSIALHVAKLRNFFRYAESRRWCRSGMDALDAPRIYRLESLPRGPQWSDVQKLLASCAGDRPTDIRDHAMLLLIAVYGLRSGEVRHLCLEDIDWEREIIHIRRAKQRKSQHYPLVHEVGAAILRYLREVRPRSKRREIFLSRVQPYRALSVGGFSAMVNKRLHRLGIVSVCYGPHSLRHSCATHLLAEGVSLKEIADHLGHVSLAATQIYAKVDMPALREVGDLPLKELAMYAENSQRAATPIQLRGSMESLHSVAAISLGGLL